VPLSDHEQRLLEQIEQALYDEDPKFARLYQSADVRSHYRVRVFRSLACFVVGLGLLLAGVIVPLIPLGVIAFVVMIASATYAIVSWQRMRGRRVSVTGARPHRMRRAGRTDPRADDEHRSVRQRLEERWQRRQDEGRL
jgi:hypothetical protein